MQANQFILVPKTILPNGTMVPAFLAGQYFCSKGADGKVEVTASGKPWVAASFEEARDACEAAGFRLLTELQYRSILHNIGLVGANFITGDDGQSRLAHERGYYRMRNKSRLYSAPGLDTWLVPARDADEVGLIPGGDSGAAFRCVK